LTGEAIIIATLTAGAMIGVTDTAEKSSAMDIVD